MALVNITNLELVNNKCSFEAPFEFDITLHVVARLRADIEFRLVYVGSAHSAAHDQVLEVVQVGPLEVGTSRFVLRAPAPDFRAIPRQDLLGVTVVILTASYRGAQFFKAGCYVNNELVEAHRETEHGKIAPGMITRDVLMSKAKISKKSISWD